MKHFNSQGFAHQALILILVLVAGVGGAGWYVYSKNNPKDDTSQSTSQAPPATSTEESDPEEEEVTYTPPQGWVEYTDSSTGISFYYPADWDKSKIKLHQSLVSEKISGTNHGPYAAEFQFNQAENKWYFISGGMGDPIVQIEPPKTYFTITTVTPHKYPAVYGYQGEGGASSHIVVFNNGVNSYMIELPSIFEEENPTGHSEQKAAMADLAASIQIK